jgi:hypothetical protein
MSTKKINNKISQSYKIIYKLNKKIRNNSNKSNKNKIKKKYNKLFNKNKKINSLNLESSEILANLMSKNLYKSYLPDSLVIQSNQLIFSKKNKMLI